MLILFCLPFSEYALNRCQRSHWWMFPKEFSFKRRRLPNTFFHVVVPTFGIVQYINLFLSSTRINFKSSATGILYECVWQKLFKCFFLVACLCKISIMGKDKFSQWIFVQTPFLKEEVKRFRHLSRYCYYYYYYSWFFTLTFCSNIE